VDERNGRRRKMKIRRNLKEKISRRG